MRCNSGKLSQWKCHAWHSVSLNVSSAPTFITRECQEWYQRSNIFFETVHPLVYRTIFTSKYWSLAAMFASLPHSTDIYVMDFRALTAALEWCMLMARALMENTNNNSPSWKTWWHFVIFCQIQFGIPDTLNLVSRHKIRFPVNTVDSTKGRRFLYFTDILICILPLTVLAQIKVFSVDV